MTSRLAFIDQPLGSIYLPIQSGSLGIWQYQVARRLADRFAVTVYSLHGAGQTSREVYEGVEFRRLPHGADPWVLKALELRARFGAKPAFASDWFRRGYIRAAIRDLRRSDPDVVLLFNFPQFVPQLKAALPGVPVVLNMQSYWLSQLDAAWVMEQVRDVDLIVTASDDVRQSIVARFPALGARTGTVYNGVDVERFTPPAAPRRPGSRMLFVGRVSPEKGVHLLVQALHEVARDVPDATLDIVGPAWVAPKEYIAALSDAPVREHLMPYYLDRRGYQEQLVAMADDLGVRDRVRFRGALAHEALVQAYHDADVLVNPSLSETFGMALVEAGASGLPVVASRTGGMQEIVLDGETGGLVDPASAPALARTLSRLLRDPEARARMGAAGRRRAVEKFSWDRTTESLVEQYDRLGGRLAGVAAQWRSARVSREDH